MAKPKPDLFDDIVALPPKRQKSWFDKLTPEQQAMCLRVKEYLAETGGPKQPRARRLREAYNIPVSLQQICIWFRS